MELLISGGQAYTFDSNLVGSFMMGKLEVIASSLDKD
jgi:hypothetical protein